MTNFLSGREKSYPYQMKRVRKKRDFSWAIPDCFLPNKISFEPKKSRPKQNEILFNANEILSGKNEHSFFKNETLSVINKISFVINEVLSIVNEILSAENDIVLNRTKCFFALTKF